MKPLGLSRPTGPRGDPDPRLLWLLAARTPPSAVTLSVDEIASQIGTTATDARATLAFAIRRGLIDAPIDPMRINWTEPFECTAVWDRLADYLLDREAGLAT